MLTKAVNVGDEVFVTDRGFRDKTTSLGLCPVLKIGRVYLHVEVYRNAEKFNFDGTGNIKKYELWDSKESYEVITAERCKRGAKIIQIKNFTSDWNFGNNIRDEALDEIIRLMSHLDRITVH